MSKESAEGLQPVELYGRESAEVVFTDLIQINGDQEKVLLELAIRDVGKPNGKVTHRVILTMDHFFRFLEVCNKFGADVKKVIEQSK